MKKKLLLFLLGLIVALAGGYAFVTRDIAATHPALRNADLPPLIPTATFYADPNAAYDYVASGDGRFVAFEKASLLGRSITVQEVATRKDIATFPADLSFIRWHPSKPLLRFIHDGDDWEVDPFAPARENWTRISPLRLSGGWLKNQIARTDDMPVLTWGKAHARGLGHLWLVSQDGKEARQIAEANEKTQYWVLDRDTVPVLRIDSLDSSTNRVFRASGDDWLSLTDIDILDAFTPVSAVRADGTLLVRSSRGRDKAVLAAFDTQTGKETVLIENPDTDVGWPTNLTLDPEPDLIRLGNNTMDRVALTERGQVFLDILAAFPQPVALGQTTATSSGRFVTQEIRPQLKASIYLLIDLEERSYLTLGTHQLHAHADALVQERPVSFTARDGLEIPAILSVPQGVSGPIPFIVDIHGGPAGHVNLGDSYGTQFLVNRGYGVLSVNFRGSTGFGKAFQSRGFLAFGRAMQDDIADAARWLVAEDLADPEALVAMGTSYGGYAAALAMTRDPDLFSAAIVEFPMLDVEFQSRYHPGFWEDGIDAWRRYFGEIDNPEELAAMREYSPSNRVDRIHGPLLLLAGARDQITAVQQVRDFDAAAREAGKDVQTHIFPHAGHGVSHWRDHLMRARLIEDFLADRVGGRSGGFEPAEIAPAFID